MHYLKYLSNNLRVCNHWFAWDAFHFNQALCFCFHQTLSLNCTNINLPVEMHEQHSRITHQQTFETDFMNCCVIYFEWTSGLATSRLGGSVVLMLLSGDIRTFPSDRQWYVIVPWTGLCESGPSGLWDEREPFGPSLVEAKRESKSNVPQMEEFGAFSGSDQKQTNASICMDELCLQR